MPRRHERLLDVMDARKGHYYLESGHHGDLWLNLDGLFARPARLTEIVGQFAAKLAEHRIDAICGPLTGGAFLAERIATELDLEFCYTEPGNEPRADTLYSVEYALPGKPDMTGRRFAVVDDVMNAASAVRSSLASLQAAGAVPVVIGALLVLGSPAVDLATEHGVALEEIASLDNTLWAPAECPLCESGIPMGDLAH